MKKRELNELKWDNKSRDVVYETWLAAFFHVPEPHLTFRSQLMFSLISAVFRQPSGVVSNEMIGVRIRIYITKMELDLIMI